MDEYIERAAAVKVVLRERKPTNSVAQNRMLSIIQRDMLTMPAADVAPGGACAVEKIRPFAGMPILRRDLFKAWRKCREIVELLPQLRGQDGRR